LTFISLAYRIPDIIKRARNNITIATFADHWGYKKEAFQADPRAPKILYDAGVPVAFKSDHPVLNAVSIPVFRFVIVLKLMNKRLNRNLLISNTLFMKLQKQLTMVCQHKKLSSLLLQCLQRH
jgi:hypothetical protein